MSNNDQRHEEQPTLWDESPQDPRPATRKAAPKRRTSPTTTTAAGGGLWSIVDLAMYLGVPVQTIYGWRQRGYGPPGIRIGKHLRWRPATVEEWLREQES